MGLLHFFPETGGLSRNFSSQDVSHEEALRGDCKGRADENKMPNPIDDPNQVRSFTD